VAGGISAKSNDPPMSASASLRLKLWPWSPNGSSLRTGRTPVRAASTPPAPGVSAAMRRRLLSVAAELFRRKGFAQATTRELAELLGLKKASLYYYVDSKEDLLYELCLESVGTISREVAGAVEQAPADGRLQAAIRSHVQTAARDRDMHTVMLTELRALAPQRLADVIEARAGYERQVRQLVSREQESGRLRVDVDAKYLTLMLLNLLNWTILWYDPSGPLSPPELGELLARHFYEGGCSQDHCEGSSNKRSLSHAKSEG
jgi:AcrR family transcriptional regulator